MAESFGAKVIVVPNEQFDHGGTRTLAAKESKGDILVFFSQDALPADKDCVENLTRPLIEDKKIGAAFGRQLPYPGASAFSAHLRLFNYPETTYRRKLADKGRYGIKAAFMSNAFSAYRKEALEEIGWFEENLIMGEDTCAAARMLMSGHEIMYVAEAAVYHSHSYKVFQEFKRYFDIGVFHKMESWLTDAFGKAEGEGLRYIRSELAYLLKYHRYHLLPEFILRNGCKFAGYKMGRNYDKLPSKLIGRLSMHANWWERQA
jgi:rhamnosyltransferase